MRFLLRWTLLVALIALAQPAGADIEFQLVWTDATGEGVSGSSHVQAEAGDTLTATLYALVGPEGMSEYTVSLLFDEDINDELDIVSFTPLLPPGFDTTPPGNPVLELDSGPASSGLIVGFGASASSGTGPTNFAFEAAEVVFSANNTLKDGVDVSLELLGIGNEILDNAGTPVTPVLLASTLEVNAPIPAAFQVDLSRMELVDEPGNPPDSNGFGFVSGLYYIGRTEVTNEEYTKFLNAVDPSGANALGLWSSQMGSEIEGGITLSLSAPAGERYAWKARFEDRPVNFVSWESAARFINWLDNGKLPGADTESGAYDMSAAPITLTGNGFALPVLNEWYKAAYWGGVTYSEYPKSTSTPVAATCDANGILTNAFTENYDEACNWNGSVEGNVSRVGDTRTFSHFGVDGMAGNVWEMTETSTGVGMRLIRGGSFRSDAINLSRSSPLVSVSETGIADDVGFRVAHIGVLALGTDTDGDGPKDSDGPTCTGGVAVNCSDNCRYHQNTDQADYDGDEVGDACDNCPYHRNGKNFFGTQSDLDRDGIGDACDRDIDGDGLENDVDPDPDADTVLTDAVPGEIPCADEQTLACDDNCPFIFNVDLDPIETSICDQADCDGDGVGDRCDCDLFVPNGPDTDGDGVAVNCDNCVGQMNPDQSDFDGDGIGDACDLCPEIPEILHVDDDGDGLGNACDTCPYLADVPQTDSDEDGVGDACDGVTDRDADGIQDSADNCPHDFNPQQPDTDGDGRGDACDPIPIAGTAEPVPGMKNSVNCGCNSSSDEADFRWLFDGTDTVGQCVNNGSTPTQVNWVYAPATASGADCCVYRVGEGAEDPSPVYGMTEIAFGGATLDTTNSDTDFAYDLCDNCPLMDNPTQEDTDGDGLGDLCDPTPMPEPGTGLGLGIGAVALASLRRRRT